MKKVLFVCLGNICRSPAAEGVMHHLVKKRGFEKNILCDSAGTCAHHVGERADSRMRAAANARGINLASISRQFVASDFKDFDYVIVMDRSNYRNVRALDTKGEYEEKLFMMSEFCTSHREEDVPDPYYGGPQGFDKVLDIVEDGCQGLLTRIEREL